MSETSTETVLAGSFTDSLSQSTSLAFSIGSLSSQRRNAQISKSYKHASSLFLTRRLTEALSAIEPLINTPSVDDHATDDESPTAPIVDASRSLRIKVWSLYLTLLNSIIELGPEDGKAAFGSQVWKNIRDRARDGSIWDEVVQVGYGGIEERVDADVVINLATLLLSQSPSQATNQQRLESYLAAPDEPIPDSTDHIEQDSPGGQSNNGIHYEVNTNTPRELESRIKILELYALHILPRNEEWEYAREFINMSKVLDEERREAFLQTLQSLQVETTKYHEIEASPPQVQDHIPESLQHETIQQDIPEPPSSKDPPPNPIAHHQPPPKPRNEKDYGIEDPQRGQTPKPLSNPPSPKPSLYKRSLHLISALHHLFSATASSLSRNPLAAIRLLLFIAALVAAFRRRGVQERVGRAWDKIRRTAGMGVKVSYI